VSIDTKIEYAHATINWWAGCTQVSPACDNCYAKAMAKRLWGVGWGSAAARHQFHGAYESLMALDRKAQRLGRPLRVFHNSLSDFFDNEVPVQWRFTAMRGIVNTPNLIHLLVTKRIGNAADMLEQSFRAVHGQREGWADNMRRNVWLIATICNQTEADRDIAKLLATPAAKRGLSMEPLLGPVSMRWLAAFPENAPTTAQHPSGTTDHLDGLRRLDWVIVGGESGANARPMHPDWVRSLRDQCQQAGVPFFFKQWGEWLPAIKGRSVTGHTLVLEGHAPFTNHPQWHGFEGGQQVARVGKKAAGRLLDGRTWDEVPA
jgi:protein gp37